MFTLFVREWCLMGLRGGLATDIGLLGTAERRTNTNILVILLSGVLTSGTRGRILG
jgi:hypothetical protein